MITRKPIRLIVLLFIGLNQAMTAIDEEQQPAPSEHSRISQIKQQAKEFAHRLMGKKQYRSEQIQQARAAAAALIGTSACGACGIYYLTRRKQTQASSTPAVTDAAAPVAVPPPAVAPGADGILAPPAPAVHAPAPGAPLALVPDGAPLPHAPPPPMIRPAETLRLCSWIFCAYLYVLLFGIN